MEQKEIVYTVIVTYNGMKWINKCLSTLRLSTVSTTIGVVDNGSNDGTCDFILTNFPEVVLMPQNKNLGFGQANNKGMLYAMEQGANHVLLLNQDAYLQPEAIEMMLKVADGKNIVTPVHLCGDGSRIDSMFRLSLRRADNELFDDLLIKGQPEPSYSIGEVCAACWFMPSSLIKEVGGFNPLFFQSLSSIIFKFLSKTFLPRHAKARSRYFSLNSRLQRRSILASDRDFMRPSANCAMGVV